MTSSVEIFLHFLINVLWAHRSSVRTQTSRLCFHHVDQAPLLRWISREWGEQLRFNEVGCVHTQTPTFGGTSTKMNAKDGKLSQLDYAHFIVYSDQATQLIFHVCTVVLGLSSANFKLAARFLKKILWGGPQWHLLSCATRTTILV